MHVPQECFCHKILRKFKSFLFHKLILLLNDLFQLCFIVRIQLRPFLKFPFLQQFQLMSNIRKFRLRVIVQLVKIELVLRQSFFFNKFLPHHFLKLFHLFIHPCYDFIQLVLELQFLWRLSHGCCI